MSDFDALIQKYHDAEQAQAALLTPDAHEALDDADLAAYAAAEQKMPAWVPPAAPPTHGTVAELLAIANDPHRFAAAQRIAKLREAQWPHNGCANMQSVLLQLAGFGTPSIMLARVLGLYLEKHNWKSIPVGQERAGDLGSTCGAAPHPGVDHIYLVLGVKPGGLMWIADNQRPSPHDRWITGHGKSPTTHFLHYVGA